MYMILASHQITNFNAMSWDVFNLKFIIIIKLILMLLNVNLSHGNVNLMEHSNSLLVLDANKDVVNSIIHYNYTNSLCVSYNILHQFK